MTGRRLKPQQRREQLLDVGAAMFAEEPYEDVFVEDIAARARVSRATLYHYFPSKRDLYVTIFKRASNRLLACANLDPQLPLADQLATGLEAHIQYFADHQVEAIAISRGALSDDPAIQAIVTDELKCYCPTPDRQTRHRRTSPRRHRDCCRGLVGVRSRRLREMGSVAENHASRPHRNVSTHIRPRSRVPQHTVCAAEGTHRQTPAPWSLQQCRRARHDDRHRGRALEPHPPVLRVEGHR